MQRPRSGSANVSITCNLNQLPELTNYYLLLNYNHFSHRLTTIKVHSVRNSVCVAGIDRDSVLAVKKQVYRLLSGRCALESFHFRNGDDIKDGALFVPKVILVAVFQPGRKLIDDSGDEGQLDEAYDEIFENGGWVKRLDMTMRNFIRDENFSSRGRGKGQVFPRTT